MPRQARKKSESGIYHVMLRGINQQQIFEAPEDYEKFLEILMDCKAICEFKIYAYCLMGNHIHLLIREGTESLEQIFKRLAGRFVYWYNVKYQRVGHLFQDRFMSEPVETEAYFLTVLCYIHQNPTKAKVCRRAEDYRYSSYAEYLHNSNIVDTEFAYELVSPESFVEIHSQSTDAKCLDISEKPVRRITDEQARAMIKKVSKCETVSDFQNLTIKARNKYLKKLRESGASIRQLSRLTGVSFNVIKNLK